MLHCPLNLCSQGILVQDGRGNTSIGRRGLCLPQGLKSTEGLQSQAKQFRWARNTTSSNLSLIELISLLCLAGLRELVLGHFRVFLHFISGFHLSSRKLQRAKVSGDEGSREAMHFWFVIWNMYIQNFRNSPIQWENACNHKPWIWHTWGEKSVIPLEK